MSASEPDEYESFPYADAAGALERVRNQYLGGVERLAWDGPDRLHYLIGATSPPPSWHFSPEGLAHHEEQGRSFWDVYIMVAFQLGYHNGVMRLEPELEQARRNRELDRLLAEKEEL